MKLKWEKENLDVMHTTWQHVLIQIKSPNNLDTWNVEWTPKTTFWHNESNETLGPFWGPMVHRQKTPPNLGRMGCACQLLSPKGPKVWFNFLCQNVVSGTHLTWQVSKSFGLLICINTCCQVVWGESKNLPVNYFVDKDESTNLYTWYKILQLKN